jgi:hypothetical protein
LIEEQGFFSFWEDLLIASVHFEKSARLWNPTLTPARYMKGLIPDKIIAYRISA